MPSEHQDLALKPSQPKNRQKALGTKASHLKENKKRLLLTNDNINTELRSGNTANYGNGAAEGFIGEINGKLKEIKSYKRSPLTNSEFLHTNLSAKVLFISKGHSQEATSLLYQN